VTRRPIGQALPRVERAVEGFQADLRRNLACVGATYAALAEDATEEDYDRAAELCPADPAYTDELR
jgi:hypothetical protein